jgi:hemoglobin/transferrin/lactoferrin receptor protein
MKYILTACIIILLHQQAISQADTLFNRVNQLSEEHLISPKQNNENLVYSAGRSAQRLEEIPATIQVITRDEILKKGYITLVDALKSLPGIKVSQPGSGEYGEMFLMRGLLGNQYMKILVNNIPIKPSVATGTPIEAQLPVRQAERIEVIYGPAAAIYGADAAIGVINIITKKAESKVFAQADINMGSGRYRYANFTVGGKAGRNKKVLQYSFFGNFMELEEMDIFQDTSIYHPLSYLEQSEDKENFGLPIRPTKITTQWLQNQPISLTDFWGDDSNYEGSITMPETNRIPAKSNLFGFELKYKSWALTYLNMYRKTHSSIGRSPYLYKFNSPEYYLADYNNKFSLTYNAQFRKFNSATSLRYSMYRMDENSSYGINFIPNITKAYQFAFSNDTELEQLFTFHGKNFEAITGAGLQFAFNLPQTNYTAKPISPDYDTEAAIKIELDTINFNNFGYNAHAFVNAYSFAQFYLHLKNFHLVAGLRGDANTLFENAVINPRIALSYTLNKYHSFRFSLGSAYKTPSANQMFQSLAHKEIIDSTESIYYSIIPNTKLKPETFDSFELGYRGFFFDRKLSIDVAGYYNKIRNLITMQFIDPSLQYSNAIKSDNANYARNYINSPSAETNLYGIDASIGLHNLSKKNITIKLSGTLTAGKEKLNSGESIDYLRGIPQSMFKLNISGNISRRTYLNIENTFMDSWQRSFMPSKDFYAYQDYSNINGYFTTDITLGLLLHKNLNAYAMVKNVFNAKYGGIDATSTDADLKYNPQQGRTFKAGLTFSFN